MIEATLRAEGVTKTWGGRTVLAGVDLVLAPGEVVGFLGPNGAGKSTLLQVLVGLLPADRGSVHLAGFDSTRAPLHVRAALGIGFLPQDGCSFDELTVAENLRALLECLPLQRGERARRLAELLAFGELQPLADHTYGTLSGGERRRVEIAKALVRQPRWLLLDEPFAALDPRATQETGRLVRRLAAAGIGVLLADHRFESVMALADRVLVLDRGAVVAAGDPAAIRRDPRAQAVYFADPE